MTNQIETRAVECIKPCPANLGDRCMWKVDQKLKKLAQNPSYGMCDFLREEILKMIEEESEN